MAMQPYQGAGQQMQQRLQQMMLQAYQRRQPQQQPQGNAPMQGMWQGQQQQQNGLTADEIRRRMMAQAQYQNPQGGQASLGWPPQAGTTTPAWIPQGVPKNYAANMGAVGPMLGAPKQFQPRPEVQPQRSPW